MANAPIAVSRIKRLSTETAKAVESTDLKARLIGQGIEPMAGGAAEFAKYLQAEMPRWAKVIKDARIPAQPTQKAMR